MKKNLRKILAATLSTALLVGTPLTVMADAPTTTAGTGNILAYSVETYVVPTSISIALNPQGYAVKTGTDDSGDVKVTDQIVSLNYGVANLSTADKILKVTLTVTGAEEITFVDSASDISSTDAAPEMYLALVPGEVTKANSGDDFEVTDVASGANTHNVTAAELTDVKMTADATKAVALGGEESIVAENNFELDAATYDVQDDKTVTFTTTQEQLAGMMEITDIGGIEGFTIQGAMNTKYDWTALTAKQLTFAPTYELISADEAAVVDLSSAITYDSANSRWEVALPEGVTVSDESDVTNAKVEGNAIATVAKNGAGTAIRFARSDVRTALGSAWDSATTLEFRFTIGGVTYKASSTK